LYYNILFLVTTDSLILRKLFNSVRHLPYPALDFTVINFVETITRSQKRPEKNFGWCYCSL